MSSKKKVAPSNTLSTKGGYQSMAKPGMFPSDTSLNEISMDDYRGSPPPQRKPTQQPNGMKRTQTMAPNQPVTRSRTMAPGPRMNNLMQSVTVGDREFGRVSGNYFCPRDGKMVQTEVDYKVGKGTYMVMCFLCVLGFALCCWIPLCMKDFKDAHHICPTCKDELGVAQFMKDM